jgi:hypothetical protein
LIWKAERAKNHHKKRLTKIAGSFENAVHQIASELHKSTSHKHRLEVLIDKWGFALPTASAPALQAKQQSARARQEPTTPASHSPLAQLIWGLE